MKFFCVLFLLVILIGCTTEGMTAKPTVSPASIAEFLELVKGQNFHQMARKGKEVFKQGLYIPNHTEQFQQFPFSESEQDRIRYVFYSFKGEASAGEIYLILEQDSGKVIEFNHFEAFFE